MSDFVNSMYLGGGDEIENGDAPVAASLTPNLISQQKISVANLGKMHKLNVDGTDVFLVDHRLIDQLQTTVRNLENALREQTSRMNRLISGVQEMQTRIRELENSQSRIMNNDY